MEPVLLGTLVSGAWNGLWVVGGALFGFLSYRPLKLALRDVCARKSYPRTKLGLWFGGLFLLVSLALLVLGSPVGRSDYWYSVGAFALMGAVFAVCDARLKTGAIGRELFGALLTVPLASTAYLSGSLTADNRLPILITVLCLCKAVVTVLYVRARLRDPENRHAASVCAISAAATAIVAVFLTSQEIGVSWMFALIYFVLLGRVMWGLSKWALKLKPMQVGLQEFGYSILFLVFVRVFGQ